MRNTLIFLLLISVLNESFCFKNAENDSTLLKQQKYESIYQLVRYERYDECGQIISELINDQIYVFNSVLMKQVLDEFNSGIIKERQLKIFFELFDTYDNHLLEQDELDLYKKIFYQYVPFELLNAFNNMRTNEYEKAKMVYNKLITQDSANYFLYSCRAECFYKQLLFDSALIDYTTALRLNPEFYFCYFKAGLIYHKNQDYKKSYEMFSKVKLSGLYSGDILSIRTAYNNYAVQLITEKDYELALKILDEGLSIYDEVNDKYQEILYTNRGIIHYKLNKYEEALKDFNEALNREGDTLKICKSRHPVLLQLGQTENAIKDLNYILNLEPENTGYLYLLGEIHYEMKNYPRVLEYMKRILAVEPRNTSALYLCGVSCDFQKFYDEAIVYYNDFLRYEQNQQDKRYIFVQRRAVDLLKSLKK